MPGSLSEGNKMEQLKYIKNFLFFFRGSRGTLPEEEDARSFSPAGYTSKRAEEGAR